MGGGEVARNWEGGREWRQDNVEDGGLLTGNEWRGWERGKEKKRGRGREREGERGSGQVRGGGRRREKKERGRKRFVE